MARLLVVEDDPSVRVFTARALVADGHNVETAEDGEIALRLIGEATGGHDLILSDIRMPVMDGIEMAERAVARWPELKILLMTGYAEQRERAAQVSGIVIDVVQKPFTLAQIRSAVARALAV